MAKVRKHNATGRSEGTPRFAQLPYWVLESEAARRLSGTAFKVLLYMLKRHNGGNNGRIAFGARSGCYVRKPGTGELLDLDIGISRSMTSNAMFELERAGFIRCAKESSFQNDKKVVREWRLTWLVDDSGEATKDFATATGEFKRPRNSKPSVQPVGLSGKLQSNGLDDGGVKTAQIIPYSPTSRTIRSSPSPTRWTHLVNHTQSAAPQPEPSVAKHTQPRAVASKPEPEASAPRGPKDSQSAGAQRGPAAITSSRIAKAALKTSEAKQNAAIDALIADNREWEAAFDAKHPNYPKPSRYEYELATNDPLPDGIMEAIAQQVTAASPARCAA